MPLYEVMADRRLMGLSGKEWRGERSFITPWNGVQGVVRGYWNTPFPGTSGTYAPCVRGFAAINHPSGIPDVAMLKLRYATLRQPGRARILFSGMTRAVRRTHDLDGQPLEGPMRLTGDDAKPGYKGVDWTGNVWHIVRGSAVQLVPRGVYRVQTAYYARSFDRARVNQLVGAVNRGRLVNLGNAEPGTVRFLYPKTAWRWGDELVYVDYYLLWDPEGHDVDVDSGAWIVHEVPAFRWNDATGKLDAVETYSRVLVFDPTIEIRKGNAVAKKPDPQTRRICPRADFTELDSLCRWKVPEE